MNKLPKLEFAVCVVVNRQAHSLGISPERTAAVACCIFILHLEDAAARTRYLNYKGRIAIPTEKLAQKREKKMQLSRRNSSSSYQLRLQHT